MKNITDNSRILSREELSTPEEITNDIPLASRCLVLGARALRPTGRAFTENNIGMGLAMRDLSAHLRETGEISGGPAIFTKKDRSQFLSAMENAIQAICRTS